MCRPTKGLSWRVGRAGAKHTASLSYASFETLPDGFLQQVAANKDNAAQQMHPLFVPGRPGSKIEPENRHDPCKAANCVERHIPLGRDGDNGRHNVEAAAMDQK